MPLSKTTFHTLLSNLHERSEAQLYSRARAQFHGTDEEFMNLARQYGTLAPRLRGQFLKAHGLSSEDSDASQGTDLSLAISPEMGKFLRSIVLSHRPTSILELGSSCGVSTLYFAEALCTLGTGKIIATELDSSKCMQIREHVAATGLSEYVDLREGDVFKTVAELDGTYGIVFIDVWASGYLELFRQIEAHLSSGSVVLADNMYTAEDSVRAFKKYVEESPKYSTMTMDFESGVEFTVVL